MDTVEIIGLVAAGVLMASALCVIAVGVAVRWVRRRPANSRSGTGRRSV
jgi:hypothetical protein